MRGIILKPEARVKIDIYTLESGNKFIATYIQPEKIHDTTFENLMRRVAYS